MFNALLGFIGGVIAALLSYSLGVYKIKSEENKEYRERTIQLLKYDFDNSLATLGILFEVIKKQRNLKSRVNIEDDFDFKFLSFTKLSGIYNERWDSQYGGIVNNIRKNLNGEELSRETLTSILYLIVEINWFYQKQFRNLNASAINICLWKIGVYCKFRRNNYKKIIRLN